MNLYFISVIKVAVDAIFMFLFSLRVSAFSVVINSGQLALFTNSAEETVKVFLTICYITQTQIFYSTTKRTKDNSLTYYIYEIVKPFCFVSLVNFVVRNYSGQAAVYSRTGFRSADKSSSLCRHPLVLSP